MVSSRTIMVLVGARRSAPGRLTDLLTVLFSCEGCPSNGGYGPGCAAHQALASRHPPGQGSACTTW